MPSRGGPCVRLEVGWAPLIGSTFRGGGAPVNRPVPSRLEDRTVRITANQVTLIRLVLLPLPVAMIYRNTHAWMLGALAVYIVLGLTDALDGYLARKYG